MAPSILLTPDSSATTPSEGFAKTTMASLLAKYTNPSIQVTPDKKIKKVEAPIETPKEGQVLLHIKCTGICG